MQKELDDAESHGMLKEKLKSKNCRLEVNHTL